MSMVNYQQCDVCSATIEKTDEYMRVNIYQAKNNSPRSHTHILDEGMFRSAGCKNKKVVIDNNIGIDVCLKCAHKFGVIRQPL